MVGNAINSDEFLSLLLNDTGNVLVQFLFEV